METLNVDLGERSYPIFIGPGLLEDADRLRPYLGQGRAVIISNDTVAPLYLDQLKRTLGDNYGGEIILPPFVSEPKEALKKLQDNAADLSVRVLGSGAALLGASSAGSSSSPFWPCTAM